MNQSLLKLQIGPVQEFIAQARSTRDLWSGSYLLSWLMAAGIRKLLENEAKLVFPNRSKQPLLDVPESWRKLEDHTKLLTPNLPNLFVAIVLSDGAKELADEIKRTIETEWKNICRAVWEGQDFVNENQKKRFEQQTERFLSISWQITPLEGTTYPSAYKRNGWQLDAVRQIRDFTAWSAGLSQVGINSNKDSLSGKEEAITGGPDFTKNLQKSKSKYVYLFKHDDWVGAITLVRRLWHLNYLRDKYGLKTSTKDFRIFSTRAIAAKSDELDDEENVESSSGEKYFAVLALDGDQIGKWINGDFLVSKNDLDSYHAIFSAALSEFALEKVRPIILKHHGFLIYAGGDDALALLPADHVLECAENLQVAFREAMKAFTGANGERLGASVGIAIAHFKSPLQDAIRAAQIAEKRAKNKLGRHAIAVSLFKRSGETIEWGAKWESGKEKNNGLELYKATAKALDGGQLSSKFPHRVIELLEPYRTSGRLEDVDLFHSNIKQLIKSEYAHAVSRQAAPGFANIVFSNLEPRLDAYLTSLASRHDKIEDQRPVQAILDSLIGLCRTVAFAHRTRETDQETKPGYLIKEAQIPSERPAA